MSFMIDFSRLTDVTKEKKLNPENCMTLFQPIAEHVIFNCTKENEHNLLGAAINYLGVLSSVMPWKFYSKFLKKYLDTLRRKPNMLKTLIRCVVSILDGFHFVFHTADADAEAATETAEKQKKKPIRDYPLLPIADKITETADAAAKDAAAAMEEDGDVDTEAILSEKKNAKQIYQECTKKFLPTLYKELTVKVDESIKLRPTIALAIANLLSKLPTDILETQLPKLLTKLTGALRDRLQSSRDLVRNTLASIAKHLGPYYVAFIVKELRAGLTRGYMLHVLGYSMHHVLQELGSQITPGSLDDAMNDCVQVCIDDIFSVVSEEKEISQVASKLKEARHTMSYDTFRMLARSVSIKKLEDIFEPLRDVMSTSESMKCSEKLNKIFNNISNGLNGNVGISELEMLTLSSKLVAENLEMSMRGKIKEVQASFRETPNQLLTMPVKLSRLRTASADVCFHTNAHLLVDLGLQLFSTVLKSGKFDKSNTEHCAMVEAALPYLVTCLDSKYNRIINLTLRILAMILKNGVAHESVKKLSPRFAQKMFRFMRHGGTSQEALSISQACFKLASILVRDCPWHPLSKNEVTVLLSFVEADIEDSDRQTNAFGTPPLCWDPKHPALCTRLFCFVGIVSLPVYYSIIHRKI